MAKRIKKIMGRTFSRSAILYSFFCVIVFCSCHPGSVHKTDIGSAVASPDADSVVLVVDSTPTGAPEVIEAEPDEVKPNVIAGPLILAPVPSTVIKPGPARKTLSEIYLSQIGVTEATGHNDGPAVERYLRSVGLGKGYAWCAAFVKWSMDSAHIKTKINGAAASCYDKDRLVYSKGRMIVEVRPNDVFTLWYNALNRIGHTGFINRQINDKVCLTVEGNTGAGGAVDVGSREGDGVYKKYRSLKAMYGITRFTQ
jgi:hypothetical protein